METITLRCKDWEAKIVPSFAMNVISLSYQGDPVLRTPEDMEDLAKFPFLYGTPLLFPPNLMQNDSFSFEGKEYKLAYPANTGRPIHIHGLLFDAPMTVFSQTETSLMGEFLCSKDRFPFPFLLTVICQLTEEGLTQRYIIKNTGKTVMPVLFGLHTTFVAKETFTVSIGKAWENEPTTRMPAKLVELTGEEKTFVTGAAPQGKPIHGLFTDAGARTATNGRYKYTLSENLTHWVIWNKNGSDGMISLEPQSGPTNGLNMEGWHSRLKPGDEEIFETKISLK